MSKIQDALRKLQTSQRAAAAKPEQTAVQAQPPIATEESQTVAVLKRPEFDPTETIPNDGRPIVEVDFELLRKNELLAPVNQQRHIADQYRLIKRPLLDNVTGRQAHEDEDANLIMVASALPGDGKTFNCINLALSMATEKDMSVLLVDADVGKPHISTLFGLESEPGLIDLLVDKSCKIRDVLLRTNVPGLSLLPAGRHDDHATELLASKRMAKVVDELSKTYSDRVVIFDSPPLLATSEARVLASRMGQIVLIVCSGVTPQHAVLDAIESLDQSKPINIVLNRSSAGFGASGYGVYGAYGSGNALDVQK